MRKNPITQVFLIIFTIICIFLLITLLKSYGLIDSAINFLKTISYYIYYAASVGLIVVFWIVPLPLLAFTLMMISVLWGWEVVIISSSIASFILILLFLVFRRFFVSLGNLMLPNFIKNRIIKLEGKLSIIYLAFLSLFPFIPQAFKTSFYLVYRFSFFKLSIVIFLANLLMAIFYGFIADVIYSAVQQKPISYFTMVLSVLLLLILALIIFAKVKRKPVNK